MVKYIFFDFWGTLVENGIFPSPVRQAKRILRVNSGFTEYIETFEEAFMTKNFETLTDAFHEVTKAFNLNPPEFVYEKLVGMWNKNTFLCKPFPETKEVLSELSKDYKLILVSNTDNLSVPQLLDKFELKEYFEHVILSCDVGILKTEKEFFDLALEKAGVTPEEVIMVGDSIPTDMEGSEKAGIKGVLVDRRDTREFESKISDLTELKNFIDNL